jgi:hypothetical protein
LLRPEFSQCHASRLLEPYHRVLLSFLGYLAGHHNLILVSVFRTMVTNNASLTRQITWLVSEIGIVQIAAQLICGLANRVQFNDGDQISNALSRATLLERFGVIGTYPISAVDSTGRCTTI